MCVSALEASFSATTIYAGWLDHPEHGVIHVFGYQNRPANLADGPNAMLLHLPAESLNSRQFIPATTDPRLLDRLATACLPSAPVSAGAGTAVDWMGAGEVEVFDHDVYTVVLATNPRLIPEALNQVPANRRPAIGEDLLDFYATRFPAHVILLCCFDNADARKAAPLLLWYRPTDPDTLFMPAVDAHTGGPPRLGEPVPRDHTLVFASGLADPDWGHPVAHAGKIRRKLRVFLPDRVDGVFLTQPPPSHPLSANGDFVLDHADLLERRLDRVRVVSPAGTDPDRPPKTAGTT